MFLEGVTRFCFAASYTLALVLELLQLFWPRPVQRLVGLGFGTAGLLAHTIFLVIQLPALSTRYGSMLFLAWILAVFYLYGTIHHRRLAWAVFVLPVVLGLIVLAGAGPGSDGERTSWIEFVDGLRGDRFWGGVHGALLLLSAVGVCVGFVASIMYLLQARQLWAKLPPDRGVRLLSLERLEQMNRRAIDLAFPLLTAGVIVGLVLLVRRAEELTSWTDPRILGAAILWLVFAILLYLRYGYHLRGRRVALWTIVAFVLMVVTLASSHTIVQGVGP
jgi:ABC-type transport system involved in cytochrome c biogenesis permease subunit